MLGNSQFFSSFATRYLRLIRGFTSPLGNGQRTQKGTQTIIPLIIAANVVSKASLFERV